MYVLDIVTMVNTLVIAIALSLYVTMYYKQKVNKVKIKEPKSDPIKDRNYYIYQLLKKTLKEYGYRKYDITTNRLLPNEFCINGSTKGSKSIYELKEFIDERIPEDENVLVYIDKSKKVLEIMYYSKDQELALDSNPNNNIKVHHKGNFTIVTRK